MTELEIDVQDPKIEKIVAIDWEFDGAWEWAEPVAAWLDKHDIHGTAEVCDYIKKTPEGNEVERTVFVISFEEESHAVQFKLRWM